MPSYNRVILMGHLTRDPELRALPSGTSLAQCGIAVNKRWKDKSGADKEEVCFIDFTVWGTQADTFVKYMRKGSAVLIDGDLRQETWEAKDGGKRSKHVVNVSHFFFVGGKSDKADAPGWKTDAPIDEVKGDDIPF